ncbi:MAG: ABC transporter substrate-binding protein [Dehalococcoidia bacterium]|nr:ABC transporter substrate-binding protein [Dehalococcoidia bacterium]
MNILDLGSGHLSRRGLLKGGAIGAAGLAGAALIGCGSDDDNPGATATSSGGGGGGTASPTPTPQVSDIKRGGTLLVDSGEPNPNVLNFGFNIRNRPIQHSVWEQLIGLTEDYQIRPVLAETFEANADSSAVHIVLRQGVEFHNGRPLTADDVAYSIDFFSNAESSGQLKGPLSQGISEVKVADNRTLDIIFNGPRPALADMFCLTRIVDRDTARNIPDMKDLVGTGPFKFTSYTPDVGYRLEANENYWQEGLPYLDAIEGKPYADVAARELAIRSGELHWADGMSYARVAALRSDANVKAVTRGKAGMNYLGLVVNKAPFDDVRVRRAASLAIDRQRLSDEFAEGVVAGTTLPWPPESPAYHADQDFPAGVAYDPDTAAALIEEAGAAGTQITIQAGAGDQEAATLGQYLQDDLNAVGLPTELVILEASVAVEQIRDRTVQSNAWLAVHGFANYAHPGSMVNAAQQYTVPNPSHFEDTDYEQLLDRMQSAALGSSELAEMVTEFNQRLTWDNAWILGLVSSEQYRVMHASLKGDEGGNLSVAKGAFSEWWLDA